MNDEWTILEPLLPKQRRHMGRWRWTTGTSWMGTPVYARPAMPESIYSKRQTPRRCVASTSEMWTGGGTRYGLAHVERTDVESGFALMDTFRRMLVRYSYRVRNYRALCVAVTSLHSMSRRLA